MAHEKEILQCLRDADKPLTSAEISEIILCDRSVVSKEIYQLRAVKGFLVKDNVKAYKLSQKGKDYLDDNTPADTVNEAVEAELEAERLATIAVSAMKKSQEHAEKAKGATLSIELNKKESSEVEPDVAIKTLDINGRLNNDFLLLKERLKDDVVINQQCKVQVISDLVKLLGKSSITDVLDQILQQDVLRDVDFHG